MRTVKRDIVGAFVFSNDGKTLLGLHGAGSSYAGFWVVLGGGVDEGESKEGALHREFLEEAGLDLSPYTAKLFGESGPDTREKTLKPAGERVLVDMYFYDFEVRIDKPAAQIPVRPNEEFAELKWVDIAELPKLNVAPITYDEFKKLGYVHD